MVLTPYFRNFNMYANVRLYYLKTQTSAFDSPEDNHNLLKVSLLR